MLERKCMEARERGERYGVKEGEGGGGRGIWLFRDSEFPKADKNGV
jgi:hypothetical protein